MDAIERRLRVSGEAADWWAVLHADEVPRESRERFVEWLRESHVHVTEMLRVLQVHGALGEFNEWDALPAAAGGHSAEVIPLARQKIDVDAQAPRRRWLPALAAGVLVAVAAALWLMPDLGGQVITTERGERREVVLSDGSIVQVDPQTRLKLKFDDEARRVTLAEGRAVFRVAKHPSRPFLVDSDGATVRAVGTAFGVERRSPGLLVVTVIEGKVAVQPQEAPQQAFLTANQQMTVRNARAEAPPRAVNGDEALAWAQGKLIFRDEPVAAIAEEFNRYNRVQLRISDETLAARRVSGSFDAAYPEEFVAFIRGAAPVRIERVEGESITLSAFSPLVPAEQ